MNALKCFLYQQYSKRERWGGGGVGVVVCVGVYMSPIIGVSFSLKLYVNDSKSESKKPIFVHIFCTFFYCPGFLKNHKFNW